MNNSGVFSPFSIPVLESLLDGPLHVRELAEKTGFAPSTAHKALSALLVQNILIATRQKNRKIFFINFDSPLAQKMISLIWIEKIIHSKGFNQLRNLKPKSIVLFGSGHTGKFSKTSDVDLAVFFNQKTDAFKLSEIKKKLSNALNREVDLVWLTREKIDAMRREKVELLNQIQYKSTVLWGEPIETNG